MQTAAIQVICILISEVNLLYYRFKYGILLLIYLSDTWTNDNHKSNCQII